MLFYCCDGLGVWGIPFQIPGFSQRTAGLPSDVLKERPSSDRILQRSFHHILIVAGHLIQCFTISSSSSHLGQTAFLGRAYSVSIVR